jgi:hypothetical protein
LADSFELIEATKTGRAYWDSTSDFIWQALMARPDKWVALLWSGIDVLIRDKLQLFLDAVVFLRDVGDVLFQTERKGDTHPVGLCIVAFGEGVNFPQWS